MIAIRISSAKNFMNHFLTGNLFDPFLVVEGMLSTAITYTFDGHINMDFYPVDERNEEIHPYSLQPWSELQGAVTALVKGKNTPILLRFMLQLKPEKALAMLNKDLPGGDFSQIKGLLLTVKYEAGNVILTTGTSYNTFVLSHDADKLWDKNLCLYLSGKNIDYEIL